MCPRHSQPRALAPDGADGPGWHAWARQLPLLGQIAQAEARRHLRAGNSCRQDRTYPRLVQIDPSNAGTAKVGRGRHGSDAAPETRARSSLKMESSQRLTMPRSRATSAGKRGRTWPIHRAGSGLPPSGRTCRRPRLAGSTDVWLRRRGAERFLQEGRRTERRASRHGALGPPCTCSRSTRCAWSPRAERCTRLERQSRAVRRRCTTDHRDPHGLVDVVLRHVQRRKWWAGLERLHPVHRSTRRQPPVRAK